MYLRYKKLVNVMCFMSHRYFISSLICFINWKVHKVQFRLKVIRNFPIFLSDGVAINFNRWKNIVSFMRKAYRWKKKNHCRTVCQFFLNNNKSGGRTPKLFHHKIIAEQCERCHSAGNSIYFQNMNAVYINFVFSNGNTRF